MTKLERYTFGLSAVFLSVMGMQVIEPDSLLDIVGTLITVFALGTCGLVIMWRAAA